MNRNPSVARAKSAGVLLEVQALSAGYDRMPILESVSLQAQPGRVTVLVGANGAGKTTLLRALSGEIPIMAGNVGLGGVPIGALSVSDRVRLGLALVPEGRHLFAQMTVLENLELGAYLVPRARRREGIERVVGYFPRLGERKSQLAGTMSGGEQQMVAVARALMAQPRCLILDEPSLGLSPSMVAELFRALQEISAKGTTVVLVEQNVYDALSIADYGYVLSHGAIVAEGLATELRDSALIRETYLGESIA